MRRALLPLGLALLWSTPVLAQTADRAAGASGRTRALTLEDYYRVKSVGSPRISPDGRWVAYTVSTPIEETNGNGVETFVVRADGSVKPVRLQHNGQDVSNPRWTKDGSLRVTQNNGGWILDPTRPGATATRDEAANDGGVRSPDGRWIARLRQVPAPVRPQPAMTEFEKRHEARFKGDAFDWYPFRQDGQRFPLPDRLLRAPTEIFLEPVAGGEARQLTRLGLQPGNVIWSPDATAIVFTANEALRTELPYGSSSIYRVTRDGQLTRLTNDGYNYGDLSFSPDGKWLAYTRSFGTDMIMEQKLNHGG